MKYCTLSYCIHAHTDVARLYIKVDCDNYIEMNFMNHIKILQNTADHIRTPLPVQRELVQLMGTALLTL